MWITTQIKRYITEVVSSVEPYLGEDSSRIYWVLKTFNNPNVKLNDSSIMKEWELMGVTTTFLLTGTTLTQYFTRCTPPSSSSGQPAAPASQANYEYCGPLSDRANHLLWGLLAFLLLAVLLSTSMCRMFLYGLHTVLDGHTTKDTFCWSLTTSAGFTGTPEEYWELVAPQMRKFAQVTGAVSALSKFTLLACICLWLNVILIRAYVEGNVVIGLLASLAVAVNFAIIFAVFHYLSFRWGIPDYREGSGIPEHRQESVRLPPWPEAPSAVQEDVESGVELPAGHLRYRSGSGPVVPGQFFNDLILTQPPQSCYARLPGRDQG